MKKWEMPEAYNVVPAFRWWEDEGWEKVTNK
jgi:hypothetical protein